MERVPGRTFIEPPRIAKRAGIWSAVALVSAGPSFLLAASDDYHEGGMLLGIALWVVMLTAITSTTAFDAFSRVRGVRRTLQFGYGLRILASVVYPVGWIVDLWAGVLSIRIGEFWGLDEQGFVSSLGITLVQGLVLNVVIGVVMLVLYPFVRPLSRKTWDGVHECEECGYDLRGSAATQCPECGAATLARLAPRLTRLGDPATSPAAPASSSTRSRRAATRSGTRRARG